MQRVILPWENKIWPGLKAKIQEPITSIVGFDSKISSIYAGKIRPRSIMDLLATYSEQKYAIEQDVILEKIIPMLQKLVIEGPKTLKNFDLRLLMPAAKPQNIAITRPIIATIIACAFFGLLEYNYISKGPYEAENFTEFSFVNIFANQNVFAFQCIMNYFLQTYKYMNADKQTVDLYNASEIIIYRCALITPPNWAQSDKKICEIMIGEDDVGQLGKVDDSPAKMHVNYVNEYLLGNLFNGILSYEEVIFLVRPESLIAPIICSKLEANESICIFGTEKMSQYKGFASNIAFDGPYNNNPSYGCSQDYTKAMIKHVLICIDASPRTSGLAQFIKDFDRDLNKAYCGFSAVPIIGAEIATGNWGTSIFGGNMQVKFIQQIIAASEAERSIIYYPFIKDFENKLVPFIDWVQVNQPTVGDLYKMYKNLMKTCYRGPNSRLNDLDLFDCLQNL